MRTTYAMIVCSLIHLAACSSDDSMLGDTAPDAASDPDPDAAADVESCPACTPAARCEAAACACPAPFVPAQPSVIANQMLAAQPGYVSGAVAVVGGDFRNHAIVVTAEDDAPIGSGLEVNDRVFVALSYDVGLSLQSKSTFFATA